jgi:tetratricopeptide (TPR) repeat protein
VNGWTKPYTVTVNGEQHQLMPGTAKKITLSEGDVIVDWPDGGEQPKTFQVETSFFGRPFNRPVFVINPDQLAILSREETVYSAEPVNPDKPPEVRTGQVLLRFEDADYEFAPFPNEIKAKQGSKVTKTRVGIVATGETQDRLVRAMTLLPREQLVDYTKRFIQLNPDDELALTFLASLLPPNQMIEYLRVRLADRPVRVEWHRIYQSMLEVAEPDKDLRPEYRKLVEETKRDPKAVYLLGRVLEGAEGDKLYKEAATGNPPSAHACAGLGFRHLARGEFDEALQWTTKARELSPLEASFRKRHLDALLAAGKYPDLLKAAAPTNQTDSGLYFRYRVTAHVALGELGAAEAEINRAAMPVGGRGFNPEFAQAAAQYRAELELVLAEVRRDRVKYLELANRSTTKDEFVVHLLRGEHVKAAAANAKYEKIISVARDWEVNATRSGLLFLAGLRAKDPAFAETHWNALVEAMNKGDRAGRMVGAMADGKQAFDWEKVKDSPMNPPTKRIVLAAVARKNPQHAKELEALARKLDFERDDDSLCLRFLME